MRNPCFSILILTYNRHELVKQTLLSLAAQTYKHFNVRLVDNGSTPPLQKDDLPEIANFELIRLPQNLHPSVACERNWESIKGDFLLWLGDDDVLTPQALETVSKVLEKNPQAEYVFGNFAEYDHMSALAYKNISHFSGDVITLESRALALGYCSSWDVWVSGISPPKSHSSSIFMSKQSLKTALNKQGRLFIHPLGDVGFLGVLACSELVLYIDLPLAVIGHTPVREMAGASSGNRKYWNRDKEHMVLSPVKGLTFVNVGVESHLKILNSHGFDYDAKAPCRPIFFTKHLVEILNDTPHCLQTLADSLETVIPAFESLRKSSSKSFKDWRRAYKLKIVLKLISAAARFTASNSHSLNLIQRVLLSLSYLTLGGKKKMRVHGPKGDLFIEQFTSINMFASSLKY